MNTNNENNNLTGWYKLTSGNNVMIRHFEDGLTPTGYSVKQYRWAGFSFEAIVVMTPEEFARLTTAQETAG